LEADKLQLQQELDKTIVAMVAAAVPLEALSASGLEGFSDTTQQEITIGISVIRKRMSEMQDNGTLENFTQRKEQLHNS